MKIKFTQLWNKLKPPNFQEGNLFSTYRRYNENKYSYYLSKIDKEFEVVLVKENREIKLGKAKLVGVGKKIHFNQMKEDEIKKDTYEYWTKEDFKRFLESLYGTHNIYLIPLFFRIKEVYKREIWLFEDDNDIIKDISEILNLKFPSHKLKTFNSVSDAINKDGKVDFIIIDLSTLGTIYQEYHVHRILNHLIEKHNSSIFILYSMIKSFAEELAQEYNLLSCDITNPEELIKILWEWW